MSEVGLEHFEYVRDLVGIDHVAFGRDTLYGDHVGLYRVYAAPPRARPRRRGCCGRSGSRQPSNSSMPSSRSGNASGVSAPSSMMRLSR